MTPLQALLEKLIGREGGVADVGDGKGVTRFGQTPEWLTQFGLLSPNNKAEAIANYAVWLDKTGLLPVVAVGDQLSDILLDVAVMSGHRQAIKLLQQALLVLPVDGVLGPQTMTALMMADRRKIAQGAIAGDMEYQGRVITDNPARAKFAAGWANRLAAHVRNL